MAWFYNHDTPHINIPIWFYKLPKGYLSHECNDLQAYSGTFTRREIVRANASLGELRRDKEKLSLPISCEFVRVKAS